MATAGILLRLLHPPVGCKSCPWPLSTICGKRLANRVQLTSDGLRVYLEAVEGAFGVDVDYGQIVKLYGTAPESVKGRYSPAECIGATKTLIQGNPISGTSARATSSDIT